MATADRLQVRWEVRSISRRKRSVVAMLLLAAAEIAIIIALIPRAEPTPATTSQVYIITPSPEATSTPRINLTDEERQLMAAVVLLEDGGDCAEGQQAVAEVIINRVLSDDFPDTVAKVLEQDRQFDSIPLAYSTMPTAAQYTAVDNAVCNPMLPADVVFFALSPENDRVYCQIGEHYFCREYNWD